MTLEILLKMVLMLLATLGIIAPAATATNPAINAYSMRSWPRVSFQILSFQTRFVIFFILSSPPFSNGTFVPGAKLSSKDGTRNERNALDDP
jgi:hypothetical protein